ncbi:MAG: hypothetical protein DWG76_03815 [Chloroflexi bacterium]|nr:hypothetical protein [Chloroflexota bacterium]
MADKKTQPKQNRKHLVGLQRERMYNRTLVIITAVIVLTVIGLVGYGFLKQNFLDPRVVVAEVEGQEITGAEFQSRVRVNRQQIVNTYLQAFQNYQLFASSPQLQQQLLSQMSQLQFQLLPSSVGSSTINQLVDDHLIILEGQKLGIQFSEADIDHELENLFAFFPNGTPTPPFVPTMLATSTLSDTQLSIVTITPTATAIPTFSSEDGESASPTPTLEEIANPTATLTATPYTADAYATDMADYVALQERDLGFTGEHLRSLVFANLYRDALFELLTAEEPTTQEQVWARHILVNPEDEAVAEDILTQLEAGADWAELAAEFSIDTSNKDSGGDLGWFAFDAMVQPFAEAAFALEVGDISQPLESAFGWHIIQALGHEDRPLTPSAWAQARNAIFQDYVQGLRNDYEWEIFSDIWFGITPDEPDIPAQYKLTQ